MSTKENVAALLRQLQEINEAPTAREASVEVAQNLATLAVLLLREHPERKQIESLVTAMLIVALDIVETHASVMN